ncbi:CxC2 domain-containing protein [Mycena chlorophos]|uniref:CxC2 domain-containing protein n=1 Tax=Mycena chlorophos TaxID=658473 RepID=A0A8H6WHQ1_MYCCL|nr:CxC2 domain-containing protein [Mycena chlorophos]
MSTHRRTRKDDRFARPALGTAQTTFSFDELEDAGEETPMTAYVDVFDAHGRHSQTTTLLDPTSPVKAARREAAAQDPIAFPGRFLDSSHTEPANPDAELEESYSMRLWSNTDVLPEADPFETQAAEAPEPKEPKPADAAMAQWRANRKDFLEVFLWHDGRGEHRHDVGCGLCGLSERPAVARCLECSSSRLTCVECCVDLHAEHPLHWVELWTGTYFKRTALRSLGLRVQFGHPPRERCSNPHVGHSTFIVIDANGIHPVALDFLRMPSPHCGASPQPRTAATFAVLDTLHALSLNAQVTPHKYYSSLEYMSDGSGIKPPYRGRGAVTSLEELLATGIGELAVRCPACPRPDINLPDGWEKVSPQDQGLYIMYIAIDACFRLKRTMVSSVMRDPALGGGLAYFVEPEPYRKYLLTVTDQKEMSTCSGLAALDHANTKFSRGYSTTGVAMCICARHEFVLPNGVGDLQRGERYANVDYIYASAARHFSRLPTRHAFLRYRLKQRSRHSPEQLVRAAEWKEMVAKFEAPRVEGEAEPPEPVRDEGLTEAQVRKQFEADEAEEAAKGKLAIAVVSPSGFVSFGLDIEEQQRRIRISAELKKANSVAGQVDLDKARRKCGDDIKKLRSLQATYAPAALVRVREEERKDGERAREREAAILKRREAGEEVKDDDEQERSVEDVALLADGAHFRGARRGFAMRNQLHIKSRLLLYMLAHSRHQAMNTRSRTLVNRNESKLKSHTDKYQMSWAAVAAVLGPDGVGPGFRRLLKADIRCMEDPEALPAQKARELEKESGGSLRKRSASRWANAQKDEGGTALEDAAGKKGKDKGKGHGESKRVLSWIWETTGIAGTEEELDDAIRVEWCRVMRACDDGAKSGDAAVVEGRIAYAEKQRDLFLALILRAEEMSGLQRRDGHYDVEESEAAGHDSDSDDEA